MCSSRTVPTFVGNRGRSSLPTSNRIRIGSSPHVWELVYLWVYPCSLGCLIATKCRFFGSPIFRASISSSYKQFTQIVGPILVCHFKFQENEMMGNRQNLRQHKSEVHGFLITSKETCSRCVHHLAPLEGSFSHIRSSKRC